MSLWFDRIIFLRVNSFASDITNFICVLSVKAVR